MDTEILSALYLWISLNKVCAVTWNWVRKAIVDNENLQMLKSFVINGFPDKLYGLPDAIQSYWKIRGSLSMIDEIILHNDQIIIFPCLQPNICSVLHSAHQGTNANIGRPKMTVYWRGITNSIHKLRDKCNVCWQMSPSQPHFPW